MGEKDNRDYLTGLYNRKGITEQYEALSVGSKVHIMFCDLDNFKSVNDIYGHAAGDKLLIVIAELLQECAPEAVVSRLSGDEFILAFIGERSKEELAGTASLIIDEVRANRRNMQSLSMVSISIGIVWNELAGDDLSQILHKSDAAMYQAKHRGKSCYVFFDDLADKLQQEELMESSAGEALQNGRFRIQFLPVFNMQNSCLEQTEVYVRWEKEDGTFWEQDEYRPLLERSGFIRKVDEYVFTEICGQMEKLRIDEQQPVRVSVLLSRLLFLQENLGERLQQIMDQHGVLKSDIEIAIAEKEFEYRDSSQIIKSMKNLKKMGFSLAVIQFGADFSCFRYLRELPIVTLRFDIGYLKENLKHSRGRQIIKTLVRLGKDLKLLVVADGIVSQEEVIFLSGCGCDAAGGSYYSKLFDLEEYLLYARERLQHRNQQISYAFKDNLEAQEGGFTGTIVGDGVSFADGISDNWGGIHFAGGSAGDNVIEFPPQLFCDDSFTISLWMKPEAVWSWGSVVFVSYLGGFASVVPFAGEGISIFRIYEEGDLNGWHDVLCHSSDLNKWTFITVTYDAFSGSSRYYIDGKKAGYQIDVPVMYSSRQVIVGGDLFQRSYTGSVSAFMVFDHAKTEEEIEELYNSFLDEPGFRG